MLSPIFGHLSQSVSGIRKGGGRDLAMTTQTVLCPQSLKRNEGPTPGLSTYYIAMMYRGALIYGAAPY